MTNKKSSLALSFTKRAKTCPLNLTLNVNYTRLSKELSKSRFKHGFVFCSARYLISLKKLTAKKNCSHRKVLERESRQLTVTITIVFFNFHII